jgi:rRNA maturation endonuclease Nob1
MSKTKESTEYKYRLFCNACTGVAEYVSEPVNKGSVVCANCGKETLRRKRSYILLTKNEKKSLASLSL